MKPLAVLLLLATPLATLAQGAPRSRAFVYPVRTELAVVTSLGGGLAVTPGLALRRVHRTGLRTAWRVSGLALADSLDRAFAATVGGSLAFPVGGLLVEPFADVGAAWVVARIDSFGYHVLNDDGSRTYVPGYRAANGLAPGGGAGVSTAGMVGRSLNVRLSVGYWWFRTSAAGVSTVAVGVGLGTGHRDDRWYRLQVDHTPPRAAVLGTHPVVGDSVALDDGRLRIFATDPSGIAAMRVNGEELDVEPAPPGLARRAGLGAGAASATVVLRPPAQGEMVRVAVRDSAGQTAWLEPVVFGAPDRTGPTVARASDGPATGQWVESRAIAEDTSGLADAVLNGCPLELQYVDRDAAAALGLSPRARALEGGAPVVGTTATLRVRDRMGNERRLMWTTPEPSASDAPSAPGARTPADGETPTPPTISDLRATIATTLPSGRRSVRVRGRVGSPGGPPRVQVAGQTAVLSGWDDESVAFDGWVVVDADRSELQVAATGPFGRSARETVAIAPAEAAPAAADDHVEQPAAADGGGSLRALIVASDPSHADSLAAVAERLDAAGIPTRVSRPANADMVLGAVDMATNGLGAGDALLVYVDGQLAADTRYELVRGGVIVDGSTVPLEWLSARIRADDPGLKLVAFHGRPTRTWRTFPRAAPGSLAPAGCVDRGPAPAGGVADLGEAGLGPILAGLAGAADADGDGVVRTDELLAYLGRPQRTGVLPFDPLAPLMRRGGDR